ncbi:MAG: hypothetical protein WAX66_00155 [Patescibacteria group bacterium]
MKKKTILLAVLLLVIATSCSQQEESANVNTPEVQVSTTPTTVPEATSTITPTPKKAEDFEGCSTMELGTSVRVNNNYSNGPELETNDVIYSNSSWIINGKGVRAEITSSKTIDGVTHFSVNGVNISTSEGSIVYISMYTDLSDDEHIYWLAYSPTSNQFLVFHTLFQPPYINIRIDPDSTVSLPKHENDYYQGNWCTIQEGESSFLFEGSREEDPVTTGKCVTYKLPNGDNEYNGDEYGWGLNKYGQIVCPQLWMEETETE